ncbi:hypothetical protein V5799_020051 [Amblyomma americanum]|uniref:Uncharacterized protein n=1 Tax=Amblyomma americanum TaxID=6943 RepID=A0AAQ4EV56_AMBAM
MSKAVFQGVRPTRRFLPIVRPAFHPKATNVTQVARHWLHTQSGTVISGKKYTWSVEAKRTERWQVSS